MDGVQTIAGLAQTIQRLAGEPAARKELPVTSELEEEVAVAESDLSRLEGRTEGRPSGFSCPDCHGVLWEISDGELVRYRCRVGHAYSPQSLLASQSENLEEALWTALRVLEENAAMAERPQARASERGHKLSSQQFGEQAQGARSRARIIHDVLQGGQIIAQAGGSTAEMLFIYSGLFMSLDLRRRVFVKVSRPGLRDQLLLMAQSGVEAAALPPGNPLRLWEAAFQTGPTAQVVLVVGDISGKGLGAATLISEVKYVLRTILREHPWPEAALSRLNDFVCEAQHQGDFGGDYQVVLSLAVFDLETGRASYVAGGGEPLLVVRAEGTAEVVGTNGLLLATDGLTKARRSGTLLGLESLRTPAALLPGALLRGGQALVQAVREWTGGVFQDDACVLSARRS